MKSLTSSKQSLTQTLATLGLLSLITGVTSGCGQTAYNEGTGGTPAASTGNVWDSGTGAVDNTVTSITDSIAGVVKSTNQTFVIKGAASGTTSQSFSIKTDSALKIVVSAGSAQKLGSTGYTVGFNCQRYQISALGSTQEAFVLRSGYTPSSSADPCYDAKKSVTLDFSELLTTGHGAVTVSVTNGEYDNCRRAPTYDAPFCGSYCPFITYSYPYTNMVWAEYGGCQMSSLYYPGNGTAAHTIAGKLTIVTNTLTN
jgi:hypothetical protein